MSVVIPARVWDRHLERTVAGILAQDLPSGVTMDVVVALAEPLGSTTAVPEGVRVLHNRSGTIPDGLNLAIAESSGDVVVRVDSRCVVQSDHVGRVLDGLEDPRVGCVGGAQLVLDRGIYGSAYAIAFNSALLGPSAYRYRRRSGAVDTAYLGAWRRSDLDAVGGFDPRLIRNQDNELADRVRQLGNVVWYDAGMVVGYYNARGLRASVQHHHAFGRWRMVQRAHGQRALTARHVGALVGLGAAAGLSAAALLNRRTRRATMALGLVTYGVAAAWATRTASRLRHARDDLDVAGFHPLGPVLAPALAVLLDGAWLTGLLRGTSGSTPPVA